MYYYWSNRKRSLWQDFCGRQCARGRATIDRNFWAACFTIILLHRRWNVPNYILYTSRPAIRYVTEDFEIGTIIGFPFVLWYTLYTGTKCTRYSNRQRFITILYSAASRRQFVEKMTLLRPLAMQCKPTAVYIGVIHILRQLFCRSCQMAISSVSVYLIQLYLRSTCSMSSFYTIKSCHNRNKNCMRTTPFFGGRGIIMVRIILPMLV